MTTYHVTGLGSYDRLSMKILIMSINRRKLEVGGGDASSEGLENAPHSRNSISINGGEFLAVGGFLGRRARRNAGVLLLLIALVLLLEHGGQVSASPLLAGPAQIVAGVFAGLAIGVVASLLGVAGGEFLIPTLILLFGIDIKVAGSLSLAFSLPTMIVGFTRYSRDQSFSVLGQRQAFVLLMTIGSIVGAFAGSQLLLVVSGAILLPLLALLLVISAVKLWRHG